MPWWGYLIIVVAIIAIAVVMILTGNWKKVKEWLVYAVTQAEQALGSGTGQLKLREVYDKFIDKFPIVSNFISFTAFSKLVDQALDIMNDMLNNNETIKKVVTPTETKEKEGK